MDLHRNWILWHDTNWEDLQKVSLITNVVQFWQVFNALPKELPHLHNLRLFRESIQPAREDPQHASGGKWIIQFPTGFDTSTAWLNLKLDIIGASIPMESSITGIEMNYRRRGNRISIWTNSLEQQVSLGQYIVSVAGQTANFKEHHEIAEQKSAYTTKSLIEVSV